MEIHITSLCYHVILLNAAMETFYWLFYHFTEKYFSFSSENEKKERAVLIWVPCFSLIIFKAFHCEVTHAWRFFLLFPLFVALQLCIEKSLAETGFY